MMTWAEFHTELDRISKERAFAETQWDACFGRKSEEEPMPSQKARKAFAAIESKAEEARTAALNAVMNTPSSERGPKQ
jgi:hypothetical protein